MTTTSTMRPGAPRGLVGYTGFVGGTLLRQGTFDAVFNSGNVEDLRGREFELLVCAAAPGVKWLANKDPEADFASISRLVDVLQCARARRLVLISTVDVYPRPIGVDEDTPIDPDDGAPYGRHRLFLENTVKKQFDTAIVRLPGLFGTGLKKNVIYDLLHKHRLDELVPESQFQFYDLRDLTDDIGRIIELDLPIVNLATEPVSVADVAQHAFHVTLKSDRERPPVRYDVRTRFDRVLGGQGGYVQARQEVLDRIRRFVTVERHREAATHP